MPLMPQITLTFTLQDYQGNALGSAMQPAWLRVALCGFGPILPAIPGTANIGQIASWQVDIPYYGTPGSIKLWGNDVIVPGPDTTYYAISILDPQRNVIQTGLYQFNGTTTVDLSNAAQIVPPYGFQLGQLKYLPCTGAVPGTTYAAPGQIVLVTYNGVILPPGLASPILSYTAVGQNITLNFTTETEDLVYALCVIG